MSSITVDKDLYLSHFERVEKAAAQSPLAWLLPTRKAAWARFVELGFPTVRDEEWRFTNVAPIAETPFARAAADLAGEVSRPTLAAWNAIGGHGCMAVFVNGRFVPSLSLLDGLPDGARVGGIVSAIRDMPDLVRAHLARHAGYQDHAFTALNTALMEDGALVYVPRGKVVTEPIHLLFVSVGGGEAFVCHPRTLVIAETNSQATVLESYVGPAETTYFTNAVTEIVADENAFVDHYKLECEGENGYHISTAQLHQYRSSNVDWMAVSFGGRLVRNDVNVLLDGEGCDTTLNGLYALRGAQHVDNHLVVDHAKPHCDSREFFRGVLMDQSRGIFSGRIIVREGAQKTDAKQTNNNLLLSEEAQVESKPQLEIFADDVKCTHGATIGQVNKDAIFYLRSRGIDEEAARGILVYAFAREIVDQIRVAPLQGRVMKLLADRIGSHAPRESV